MRCRGVWGSLDPVLRAEGVNLSIQVKGGLARKDEEELLHQWVVVAGLCGPRGHLLLQDAALRRLDEEPSIAGIRVAPGVMLLGVAVVARRHGVS